MGLGFAVQADYAVELGPEDQAMEFPWFAPEKNLRYYDVRRHPELLSRVDEVHQLPALQNFLVAVNSFQSILETAKCDVWSSMEINPEEEIFGCDLKFGSYIDFLFSAQNHRFSFQAHEQFAKDVCDQLKRTPEIPASAEFLIRRCYYRSGEGSSADGYYITFYLFGYGDDEEAARLRWSIGLDLARDALIQLSFGD